MATATKATNAPKPVTDKVRARPHDVSRRPRRRCVVGTPLACPGCTNRSTRLTLASRAVGGSMAGLSIQELQYLASAAGSEAGMFGG